MGVSPAIFETAGQRTEHYIPGTYTRSNNVSSPSGVSAGNFCILGTSTGGKPMSLLSFGNLSEAKEQLVGGDLLKAVAYAFEGSNDYVPQKIHVMRVNEGTQASRTLTSSSTTILTVKSWDWGLHTNQLKMWVKAGTQEGSKKIVVAYKQNETEVDNIIKPSFSVVYTGDGTSPTITITTTGIKLMAQNNTDVVEFSFTDAPTIDDVVTRINDSNVYIATNLSSSSEDRSDELDTVAQTSISEEKTLYSNLKAFIDALKSLPYIGDVVLSSSASRVVPDNDDSYVYFTGGTNGDVNWNSALTALETEDIQIIAATTSESTILSSIASHCTQMSSTVNRKERTCWLGGSVGETDEAALATAKGFNNKLVSYVTDSVVKNNPIDLKTETLPGYMVACMLGAMESAMAVNEPLTFKTLNILGVSKIRTNPNMEKLIKGGIVVINPKPENPAEYVVIRSITTYQGNNDLISCERSMVREDLYMNRDLRNAYSPGIGRPNDGSTAAIIQTLKDRAAEWATSGYIIPDGTKNVWNISVRISGDKIYLTYSRYLTAPRNFVFATATNHVYETTQEL